MKILKGFFAGFKFMSQTEKEDCLALFVMLIFLMVITFFFIIAGLTFGIIIGSTGSVLILAGILHSLFKAYRKQSKKN